MSIQKISITMGRSHFTSLPDELQCLILSFLDFPTLNTLLTVNKNIHHLSKLQPPLCDPEARIQFLISQEDSPENNRQSGSRFYPAKDWGWPGWACKKRFICFLCVKLLKRHNFAHGQFYRLMIYGESVTALRKRFCIECGMKGEKGKRKYEPGAMINSVHHGFGVYLCGDCKEWSGDFYCMKEKLCFACTEKHLVEQEKFVVGYREGLGWPPGEWKTTEDLSHWDEFPFTQDLIESLQKEGTWPRRPPCCRSCGTKWRYSPVAFAYAEGRDSGLRGYFISGVAKLSLGEAGTDYHSGFVPYPYHKRVY